MPEQQGIVCADCGHVWGGHEDASVTCHNPQACTIRKARETLLSQTGFESKVLRVVIENWLYHTDLSVIMDATTELRRRFCKTFPCPEWALRLRSKQ